jgi:hypothetical protein
VRNHRYHRYTDTIRKITLRSLVILVSMWITVSILLSIHHKYRYHKTLKIHAQNGLGIDGIDSIDILQDNNYYSCYYCDYKTDNKDHYERHVILRHPSNPAYPNMAEIEKRGLKPQGKDWEM